MDESDTSALESTRSKFSEYSMSRNFAIAIAVLFIFSSPIILNVYFPESGLEAVSIIISGILSLGLILLYEQQYQLLDRQTSLMEHEFGTEVNVRGDPFADGDEIYLTMRNTGRGMIRYIYLKSEVVTDTGEIDDSAGYYQLRTIEGDTRSLEGLSDAENFVGKVKIRVPGPRGEERDIRFKQFTNSLIQAEIEECTVRLSLEVIGEKVQDRESPELHKLAEQEITLNRMDAEASKSEKDESEQDSTPVSTNFSEGIPRVVPQPVMPRELPVLEWPDRFTVEDE